MIALILTDLLKVNLAAGAAVLLVLALRKPTRSRFGARAAYALWLAPLAAAIAVLAPHPAAVTPVSPIVSNAEAVAVDAADAFIAQAPVVAEASGSDAPSLLFTAWLIGALAAGGLVLQRQRRFTAAMGRLTPSDSPRVFRAERPDVGPAVVGVFRPRIVAPADFEARFGPQEQDLILTHEWVHLAGGDASINALACVAQCLCWFNPLAHLAVRLLRIDQELACDAAVIGRFPDQRRAYAELLLKTQIAPQPLPFGCHWPAGADHPLKERITMLKSPLPHRTLRATGVGVALLLAAGAGGLAWATEPGPSALERLQAQKVFAEHPDVLCKPDPDRRLREPNCHTLTQSVWAALPTPADVMRYYPPAARRAGIEGVVSLGCKATPEGLLDDCAVLGQNLIAQGRLGAPAPAEYGFGPAALKVARYFQFNAGASAMINRNDLKYLQVHFTTSDRAGLWRPQFPVPRSDVIGPPPPGRLVAKYEWVTKPGPGDIARVYPAQALKDGTRGKAEMTCIFRPNGRLEACGVDSESPAQAGFGAAALKLAPVFQAKILEPDGTPVGDGKVRLSFMFSPPAKGGSTASN